MKEATFVSIVLYVRNNAGTIGEYLQELDRFADSKFSNYELILVNDASTDGTGTEIRKVTGSLSRDITTVNLAWQHGPERGLAAGVDLAIGDLVLEMDLNKADYDLSLLYQLFQEASRGFDVVAAAKPRKQQIIDRIGFSLFNRVTYLPFTVLNESVRIVSRRAVNAILGLNESILYRSILYKYSGFPSKTIEYSPVRQSRTRGLKLREKIRLGLDVLVSYSNIGTNISVLFAAFFALVSVLLGLYGLIAFLTLKVVPGWTTTILFMSICFLGVFTVMGLQGRYISMIVLDMKRRPAYIVNNIERSSRQNAEVKK